MSVKKLHTEFNTFYYYTFTCFQWWNLFDITNLYDFIYQWFGILLKIKVYNCGFVIMPNHMHGLVYTRNEQQTKNKIIGTGKRFIAYEIVDHLELLCRKDLLKIMSDAVTPYDKSRNKHHEVFEDSFDCKEIITETFIRQKLTIYIKTRHTRRTLSSFAICNL